jgi:hypothetical protein
MRLPLRASVLLLSLLLFGCTGNSQAEKLVTDNIRLLNDYADAMEQIGTVPSQAKIHELQQRITKDEAAIHANNEALKAYTLRDLKAIGDRHREEADRVQERFKNAFKVYRAKMPNLKKGP